MIDYDILKQFGTTPERIRKVFSSRPEDDLDENKEEKPDSEKLYKWREKFENRIYEDLYEGLHLNFRSYYLYASADLAWDGNIITKEIVPHMLYAQGKISFGGWIDRLKKCGASDADIEKLCGEKDEDTGEFKEEGVGQLIQMPVNLVRSLLQRRAAAQISKYVTQYPFFKYETYSRSWEAQLRADVLSNRVEIMSNQYDYRKQLQQTIFDFLLYPHFVEFPAQNWHCEKQYRKSEESSTGVESYIVREGVPFVRPHPSRVSYDISSPLSSINSDNGPEHVLYWEVVKWGDVKNNFNYFNKDNILYHDDFHTFLNGQYPYWNIYYSSDFPCRMEFPLNNEDVAGENNREQNMGYYSGLPEDQPIILTEYRRKIIPKDWGLGDYPYPVWIRLVVAGERTVVYGEILPSLPAVYYGFNENDNRLFNISFAHEVMPWQDQATRMQTQILASMQQSLLKVLLINKQLVPPAERKELDKILKNGRYTTRPIQVDVDFDDAEEIGKNLDPMQLKEADQTRDVNTMVRGLVQLISLAERTLNFSPQEQGQPAPREISATEVLEIAATTNTVYEFISNGIDFGNGAKKRIIYDSLVSLSKGEVFIPVTQRYPKEVVEKAGFRLLEDDEEETVPESAERNPTEQTVIGSYDKLVYNYIFNSRDGSQRISDAKSLQTLNGLVQLLLVPDVRELVGNNKIIEVIAAIFRASGVPVDVDLDPESQQQAAQKMGNAEQMQESLGQMANALAETAQANNENAQQLQEVQNVVETLIGEVNRLERGQSTSGGPIQPVSQFDQGTQPLTPRQEMPNPQPFNANTADPFEQS